MAVTAKDVQALRQATGAGMMDAKRALTETDGDMERAKDLLREKGLAAAAKRTDRAATQGTIGSYMHEQSGRPVIGVTVVLSSETDFVAKSDEFQTVADDLAMHIAASAPKWITIEDVPADAVAKERELIAAQARNEGKPDAIIEKIVEGRVKSFYADYVLTEQKFVRSDKFDGTVGALVTDLAARMGENISVTAMARLVVGEEE
ncbi:MAG: elongation factor Ts [Actinobacteria bacterium]|uniref:Translation elongation factor Ts n=1 Tax=hydrothermal vent metagenome TaxID=652676 RepID=A0A3B0SF59_9ZZZZ|nr:elongation factor Ts [Actinomycetota bacterium]